MECLERQICEVFGYWYPRFCIHESRGPSPLFKLCSWELRMQKLKFHLLRIRISKVLLLKPGAGQYIAMHATLTARDFFLANFYPSGPFTCVFFKTSSKFFVS